MPRADKRIQKFAADALIYTRVSTKKQADNCSRPTQEANCRDFCKQRGWNVGQLFTDSESATSTDRPGFQALMAHCRKHHRRISHVVVNSYSRWSRDQRDFHITDKELASLGIELISATEPHTDKKSALWRKGIASIANESDNLDRAEAVTRGMQKRLTGGKWMWKLPIGYLRTFDANGQSMVTLDADRAPLMLRAFQQIAAGQSTREVCRWLKAAGLRTIEKGRALEPRELRDHVRKPLYYGIVASKKWQLQGIGSFTPLVDEALWKAANASLKGRPVAPRKASEGKYVLRQFARCWCGSRLTASTSKNHQKSPYAYYCCYVCRKAGRRGVSVRVDLLDAQFVQELERRAPGHQALALLEAAVGKMAASRAQAKRAEVGKREQAVRECEERRDRIFDMYMDGKLTEEQFQVQSERAENALADATAALQAVVDEQENAALEAMKLASRLCREPHQLYAGASHEFKVRFQQALFSTGIQLQPDKTFGTDASDCLLTTLAALTSKTEGVVGPPGFEPGTGRL